MQAVKGCVDRRRGRAVERQRELDGVVTEQVAERDADQRDAPTHDLGQGVGEQDPAEFCPTSNSAPYNFNSIAKTDDLFDIPYDPCR